MQKNQTKPNLTKRQRDVLTILYQYISTEGYPPSFEELRNLLDVASNQTITDVLAILEKKGAIKREGGSARGLAITRSGFESIGVQPLLPLAGASRGGPLTEAIGLTGEWRTAGDVSRISREKDVFLIKVHGDSMNGVIWDGDVVLVAPAKSWSEIHNRDIILIEDEGQTTVKRFVSKGGKHYLKPENPAFPALQITKSTRVQGRVIARL